MGMLRYIYCKKLYKVYDDDEGFVCGICKNNNKKKLYYIYDIYPILNLKKDFLEQNELPIPNDFFEENYGVGTTYIDEYYNFLNKWYRYKLDNSIVEVFCKKCNLIKTK